MKSLFLLQKKYTIRIIITLTFLICAMQSFSAIPCSGKDCPLPKNFDYIISCCINKDTDKEKFVEKFQKIEAARQQLIAQTNNLQKKGLISPTTVALAEGFITWEENATNKPISQWPPRTDFEAQADKVISAIEHDRKMVYLYKFICLFSKKYCW